jgi:hypothetical protein
MERLNPSWRKSTYSGNGGANCVEVGSIPWRKSSYSSGNGGECVETGTAAGAVLIRDTKNHGDGLVLIVAPDIWRKFTTSIKR